MEIKMADLSLRYWLLKFLRFVVNKTVIGRLAQSQRTEPSPGKSGTRSDAWACFPLKIVTLSKHQLKPPAHPESPLHTLSLCLLLPSKPSLLTSSVQTDTLTLVCAGLCVHNLSHNPHSHVCVNAHTTHTYSQMHVQHTQGSYTLTHACMCEHT